MNYLLSLGLFVLGAGSLSAAPIFINEFHYDNTGGDTGEFVEIAGPAGSDLSLWSVVLYNGNNNQSYGTIGLSGVIDDEGSGFGALAFFQAPIQNGAPDGVALVDPSNAVIQFLSYEGLFTAANGPAAGLTSTDVGVSESSSTPAGFSLQLTGTGADPASFTWSGPSINSPGDLNANQTIAVPESGSTIAFLAGSIFLLCSTNRAGRRGGSPA